MKKEDDGVVTGRWTRVKVYNKETREDVEFPALFQVEDVYSYLETHFQYRPNTEYLDIFGLEDMENARYEDGFLYFTGTMKYGSRVVMPNNWVDSENFHAKTYTGEFKNTKRHGNGRLIYENGDEYIGEFKDNYMDGLGKIEYENGDIYQGDWLKGKKHGDGKMKYANRDTYEGDWVNDKRHGQGKMVFLPRETNSYAVTYEGDWKDNGLSFGKIVFTNGNTYQGNFINNKFDGFGTMIKSYGETYEGGWSKGKRNGYGKLILPNGKTYEGEWNDDVFKPVATKGTRSRHTRSRPRRVHQKRRIIKSMKRR